MVQCPDASRTKLKKLPKCNLWMLVVGPYFEEVVIIVLAVAHPVLIHFSNSRQGVDVDNDVNSSELNKAQTPPLVPPPLSASSADTRF